MLGARTRICFFFKVDFEKAFDLIDWSYLTAIMKKNGFSNLVGQVDYGAISTDSASVIVNGSLTAEFKFECGLRQGDPLYPFLFLLAAEGLKVMMKSLVEVGLFSSYKVNFHKSICLWELTFMILGWRRVSTLNCKLGRLPFIYLAPPIGGDPCKLNFWRPLLDHIKSKLSDKNLSLGSQLVLLKSVLSNTCKIYEKNND